MMALHPEAAEEAQAEIDSVIGRERIPDLHDRSSLPYMEALLQEVMRMCPVVPLGMTLELLACIGANLGCLQAWHISPQMTLISMDIAFRRAQQSTLISGKCNFRVYLCFNLYF